MVFRDRAADGTTRLTGAIPGSGGEGSSYLSDLLDVNILGVDDGDFLSFDESDGTWKPGAAASSISTLTDVDLTGGVGDGQTLVWNAADSKWIPSMSLDEKNFRGDWQNTSETLIWSSNNTFGPGESLATFWTIVTGSGAAGLVAVARAGYTGMAASYTVSGNPGDTNLTLNIAAAGLTDAFVKRVEMRTESTGVSASHVRSLTINGTTVFNEVGAAVAASDKVYSVNTANPVIRFRVLDTAAADGAGIYFGNLRVYGAASMADLYHMNDVVRHSSKYWRSLYDNNTVEPVVGGTAWLEIAGI